jgi:putative transcriptional regulator
MLQHTHTGLEMTCVLSGAFSQNGAHYGPGDFDWGDEDADHRPIVDPEEECICLIAMEGRLRLEGFIGRLVQPLIRM